MHREQVNPKITLNQTQFGKKVQNTDMEHPSIILTATYIVQIYSSLTRIVTYTVPIKAFTLLDV